MKAVRIHAPGDATALQLDDVPVPAPGPGEALVRLSFAGLNFIDVYQRSGVYTLPLPTALGMEGAGMVEALGEGVTDLEVGARVAYAMQLGSYAEFAVVPAWKLAPVPDGVTDAQAAAVILQGMTAHYLMTSTFKLEPGHTCLVHAAAGGVGLLLVQLAKQAGAFVIGTVSNEEKAQLAKAAGADAVILYTETDFEAEVRRITEGKRLEVVYDSVGRTTFAKGLEVLKPRGMMVLYGGSSGQVEPFDLQVLNQKGSLFVTRPSLGHYLLTRDELLWRSGDLFRAVQSGSLSVRVDSTFPLASAAEAHRAIESRATKGKVLLEV
jgi:NADPH2:quinone reductase